MSDAVHTRSYEPDQIDARARYYRYYRVERVQMKISGLLIAAGAVATVEACIRLWSISPPLALAPVVGLGLLLGLLTVLGMALGAMMEGDSQYTPERKAAFEMVAWKLAGIICFFGSGARIFSATTGQDLPATGPEVSAWTVWGIVLVITVHWTGLLWNQFRTGQLRLELRTPSTAGPAWWELGAVAGLVVSVCTVFVFDVHPLALLWLMPTLSIAGPIVSVFVGRVLSAPR